MAKLTRSKLMRDVEQTWPSIGHGEIFAAMRVVVARAAEEHVHHATKRGEVIEKARGHIRAAMSLAMDYGVPPQDLFMIVMLAHTASKHRPVSNG